MIIEVLLLLVAVTTSDGSIYQNVFSAGENPEYTLEHCREIVVPTFLNSLYQDNTNIVDTHTQCVIMKIYDPTQLEANEL